MWQPALMLAVRINVGSPHEYSRGNKKDDNLLTCNKGAFARREEADCKQHTYSPLHNWQ